MAILTRIKYFLFFPFLFSTLSSCITTKKHSEAINSLNNNHQTKITQLRSIIDSLNNKNQEQLLNIAQKTGENTALYEVQNNLQERIDILQGQIENINIQASDQQESLASELDNRNKVLQEKQKQIQELEKIFSDSEVKAQDLLNVFQEDFSKEDSLSLIQFKVENDQLSLIISQSLLFSSRNPLTLKSSGIEVLEKVGKIINGYPDQNITIIGHTDNTETKSRSYKDNLDLSVLKAATIGRYLVEDFGLNANQIIVSGKGEFAPLVSNQSKEGKEQNRRIELVIAKSKRGILRTVRKKIESIQGVSKN